MDIKGDKVESYKLTKDQVKWSKKYKKLKLIEGMIKKQTMIQKQKFNTLQEMYSRLTQEFQGLAQQMPLEQTHEMDNMDFPQEQQEQPPQQQQPQDPQQPPQQPPEEQRR